jgi:2-polyprenyl-3-methyl-5-hydroxy-6-metoxy-1,4-benzoquinol methylase
MSSALKSCVHPHLSFSEFLLTCYYRFVFGRDVPLAAELDARIASFERQHGRPDIPIAREAWEAQYAGTQSEVLVLSGIEEQTRFDVIAGYIKDLKPRASVLDVGCGKGLLLEKLRCTDYAKYLGIDISQTAIDQAARQATPKSGFAQADAQSYVPAAVYDVIVFNESLYYLENPLRQVERYAQSLGADGIFITSLVESSVRAVAISRWLKRHYLSIVDLKISENAKTWMIDVFAPTTSLRKSAGRGLRGVG